MSTSIAIKTSGLRIHRITPAKWIGYFALVDLLFFPYMQIVIVPFSLPLLLIAVPILKVKIKRDKYYTAFLMISFGVTVSVFISFFLPDSEPHAIENFKRLIQLLSSFLYFFYFRWLGKNVDINIKPIILLFLAWYILLAMLFLANPNQMTEFIKHIYGRLVREESLLFHVRFAYCFTDPNTAVYFFLVAAFSIFSYNSSTNVKGFVIILVSIAVIISQSKGGYLVFCFSIIAIFCLSLSLGRLKQRIKSFIIIAFMIPILFFSISILNHFFAGQVFSTLQKAYDLFQERGVSNYYNYSENTRIFIYESLVSNYLPLPFGRGYNFGFWHGDPESNFFGVLYSYGFLTLIPLFWFLFSKIKEFPCFIFSALMAFSVNSLINEQKLFSLYLALLAILISKQHSDNDKRVYY